VSGLRHFHSRVTQQIQDPFCSLWLAIHQNLDGLLHGCFPKVRPRTGLRSIEAIEKRSDIEQFGSMFEKILVHDLFPSHRAGGGFLRHDRFLQGNFSSRLSGSLACEMHDENQSSTGSEGTIL
jgi:hypothetical protein